MGEGSGQPSRRQILDRMLVAASPVALTLAIAGLIFLVREDQRVLVLESQNREQNIRIDFQDQRDQKFEARMIVVEERQRSALQVLERTIAQLDHNSQKIDQILNILQQQHK